MNAACLLLALLLADPAPRTPKEALQGLNDLIGVWRGTGLPEGTPDQRKKGFWSETLDIQWQFKDKDVYLRLDFKGGKHFTSGELRYLPTDNTYQLTTTSPDKQARTWTGRLDERRLTLERQDEATKERQRLIFSLLHANRFLYRYETSPEGKTLITRHYQVGATKEGVPFAAGDNKPECVVSGGLGTMTVSYKGKTWYVCCSGCRDAFRDDPEKYIKEFEERKAQQKQP